jgi:amino acid transporter
LLPYTVELCLAVLVVITAINLRGVAHSARVFMAPTAVFVASIAVVIVVGLVRQAPAVPSASPAPHAVEAVGLLLLLKAFSNGCAALTGVEAIANAVPSFRTPGVKRAQRTETALGVVLGVMLVGLAALIGRFHIHPVDGTTVLVVADGDMNTLVPLFAIGVFVGFTIAGSAWSGTGGSSGRRVGDGGWWSTGWARC